MMYSVYYFVDGSALLGDVYRLRKHNKDYNGNYLHVNRFVKYFTKEHFFEYHAGGFRRFVFYFVKGDKRIREMLNLPEVTEPGSVDDTRVEYCGKRIKQLEKAHDWIDKNEAPDYVRECMYRSEKAVDTQICCDALQLAGYGRLDRLFLYSNDFDFVPLCRALRQLGCNINLFRLYPEDVNSDLVNECDAFHVVDKKRMEDLFTKK